MKRLAKQLALCLLVIAVFLTFNGCLYLLLTARLSNNFSDTSQAKMIDVKRYLPHEADSELANVDTSFALTDHLPVLDGAAALVPVYASVIDNVYPEGCVTYEGGVFSDDNFYGENFAADSAMQYRNTVRGYRAVVDGDCDILFCAAPSEEQRQYAAERGVELTYIPIGREAFVFFVNEKNPVSNLSAEQVRDIYAGEIRNWRDVGGINRPINPVTRLEGSGSQSAMNAFMGERSIGRKSPFAFAGASIGFSFRYYMDGIVGNEGVKMLSLNGVYPDAEHIRNGSYPIVTEFYAIYRTDHANPNVPLLIEWMLSDEGQQLIEQCGYVRLS